MVDIKPSVIADLLSCYQNTKPIVEYSMSNWQTDECCILIEDYDDDGMFDVSFERILTPISTFRGSTTTSIASPSSK